MPFVDPDGVANPATGDPITAAWGDQVNADLNYLATNRPHCIVYNSGNQLTTTNTLTKLDADSETSDIGGMHSTVSTTSRITVPTGEGGLYMVTATVSYAANATGERLLRFLVDNTTAYPAQACAPQPTGGLSTVLNGTRFISLAAGSYVEVQVRQNSGGDLNCVLQDFSVLWIATA